MDRRSRSRSRSPSPIDSRRQVTQRNGAGNIDRERLERERRERMARLRSENDAEERGLTSSLREDEAASAAEAGLVKKRNRSKKSGNEPGSDEDEEIDEEQNAMMQMLGFGGFGSTKGKAVVDNQMSAARGAASKNKGRKYRQYMNRKGGFNRPLDKMN